MSSFNRVTLLGNLTRDPELKRTKSGSAVTDIGLAMNRSRTLENGEKQDETTFVDVTVWGKTAENAVKYLQKGRSVLVEGRLQLDTWTDSKTGQNRSKLRVVAESLQFLGQNQHVGSATEASGSQEQGNPDGDSYSGGQGSGRSAA